MKIISLAISMMLLVAGTATASTSGGALNQPSFSAGVDGNTIYQNGNSSGFSFSADPGQVPGSTNEELALALDSDVSVSTGRLLLQNQNQQFSVDRIITTPIPGAVWLLGSGLLGLVGLRRRFKK